MAEAASSGFNARRKCSLAQTDLVKYRRSFDAFDPDSDGTISATNLREIALKLGYRMTKEEISTILENNNMGTDARLSFEQFLSILPQNEAQISEEQHRFAHMTAKFRQYDVDNNGVISLDEAQWALQVEMKISPQTALRMLNQFVKLDYEQFVDFYQQMQKQKLEIYDKFGKYDKDMDGQISLEEAHQVLHQELGYDTERSKALVARFDTNHDGLVSYVEFAEFYIAVEDRKTRIRQAFLRFDKAGRGYVSLDEAKEILEGVLGFSGAKCLQAIDTYDRNKDGKIDYEEFLSFFTMIEEERQRLLDEFKSYDCDGDGRISYEEFRNMLHTQGYSEHETKTLMAGHDLDHDGFLNFGEFKKFLNFS